MGHLKLVNDAADVADFMFSRGHGIDSLENKSAGYIQILVWNLFICVKKDKINLKYLK
jgi:hypothetical protein